MRRIAIVLLLLGLASGCAGMEVKEVTLSINLNLNLPGGPDGK